MMAAFPHPSQLQHAVSQAPQPIAPGHPGQPTPHAMQHLHPNNQAYQHQQQMQAIVANSMNINPMTHPQLYQQHQQMLARRQHMLMNGLAANGISATGNPGMQQGQQLQRAVLPNGMHIQGGGNPQAPAMGFPGSIRGLPPHLQHQLQHQAQQQQLAAQQLMASQGVNVQSAGQPMSMPQQQVNIPAGAAAAVAAAAANQQQVNIAAAHAARSAAAAAAAAAQQQQKPTHQAMLKMHLFVSALGQYDKDKTANSMPYWRNFVGNFFSPIGSMRQVLWNSNNSESKMFDVGSPILARYFWELIESGVRNVQLNLEGMREREMPNGQGAVVECQRAGMIYWYKDAICFHHGGLRATLNQHYQIDLLEFSVSEHQELVQRSSLKTMTNPNDSPDVKASPRSKQLVKQQSRQQLGQQQTINMPDSCVNHYGLAPMVIRFLETAETLSCMGDLMQYCKQNQTWTPRLALNAYVHQLQHSQQQQAMHHAVQVQQHHQAQQAAQAAANAQAMQNQQGHPGGPNQGGPQMHQNSPHLGMMAGSPSAGEGGRGGLIPPSPHIGQTPSPASNQLQAPGQQPQQHPISNPSSQNSTTVVSANTSPSQPNKRRRPSSSQNIKTEVDDGNDGTNGQKMGMKPSPRMAGNKRAKTNPS